MGSGATSGRDDLVRAYAAGEVTWHDLQWQGFEDFTQLLAGLAELELPVPVAPMDGPNAEARRRGRSMLRAAIASGP